MALPLALNQQKIGGYTAAQLPTLNSQQQGLQNQSIQQLLSMLGQGAGGFEPIRQQAQRGFGQNISSLAERFTALNPSAQRSSAFQGSLANAASGLESDLAAQQSRYSLGQQGLLSQLGMQPSFENLFAPPQQQSQGLGNLLGGLGTGIGAAAPLALSSYFSAAAPAAGTAATGAGLGGLAGLGALGPIGLAVGGGAGLIALLNYLARNNQ